MFIKEEKGRKIFACDECKKLYSFKIGRPTRYGMECCCREHGKKYYPLDAAKRK